MRSVLFWIIRLLDWLAYYEVRSSCANSHTPALYIPNYSPPMCEISIVLILLIVLLDLRA